MTQEILPVLEAHAGRAQTPAERVFEVMHSNLRKRGTLPRFFPSRVQHVLNGRAVVGEHVRRMFPASSREHN